MEAIIIDGQETAQKIRATVDQMVVQLRLHQVEPCLAVVLVGDNPASMSYVKAKAKACQEHGVKAVDHKLPLSTTQAELMTLIDSLNQNPLVHGILVQLPLPSHISEQAIIEHILPTKDVDGFHPLNVGKMLLGQKTFLPCTPHGIIELLKTRDIHTAGKHVVVLGRSNIVGKPMAALLLQKGLFADATVTVCHSKTKNLASYTKQADIIIAAIGSPAYLQADMVKPGVVVIDVGVNRVADANRKSGYRLVGDADFEGLKTVASYITPVPGGVGPMTITMLLYNTVLSAMMHAGFDS